jgi:hypothetical protein
MYHFRLQRTDGSPADPPTFRSWTLSRTAANDSSRRRAGQQEEATRSGEGGWLLI